MIEQLNPQQRQAVTLPDSHALVLAGAGSGKTRVLTTRMAWLMQQQQISPHRLLAVTFTNKAAREMLARLSALLPLDTRGMWVGTFHGLCNRLLRAHHRDAGLLQTFQILDVSDQLSAIKRLLKSAGITDDQYAPREVQRFINRQKEEGVRPAQVSAYDAYSRNMADLYARYQDQCEREGVVDFAELLLRAYELLKNNQAIREHYQRRFAHILVDEFQDTNNLQYLWLQLLSGGSTPIFAVGDDDQSIYAFRGANIHNMADFERDYAKGNVIRLEQNYRSHGHILDAANALISQNTGRLGKNLWTDQGAGEPIRVYESASDQLEAQWLIDEIKALVRDGHIKHEITVLYRSNAQSRVIEHALFSAGLPYKVYGGLRFFERQEIKHALAYLRLLDNPNDDTAWLRVVNFPTRGIGARTQEQLIELAQNHNCSLHEAVSYFDGRSGARLLDFVQLIQQMAHQAQVLNLPELVEYVVKHSGLKAHYQDDKDGLDRLENLQELVTAAAVFAAEEGAQTHPAGRLIEREIDYGLQDEPIPGPQTEFLLSPLAAFLSHASLEAGDNQAERGEDAIQLMTVHAAKGLEFDSVFISGLEDGLFPHENSLNERDGLEEERRLMYVALTRARKRLYITLAQSRMIHGKTRFSMRSRFLSEIPSKHLKWLSPKESSAFSNRYTMPSGATWRGQMPRHWGAQANTLANVGVEVSGKHFRVGMGVTHPKFGDGTITRLSGSGPEAQAEIHFRDVGAKTLALGIAKLDIIT